MKKLLIPLILALAVQGYPAEKSKKKEPEAFTNASRIVISLISLSLESYGPMKPDRTFKPGESVFINLQLRGLTPNKQKKFAVQADILVPQLDQDQKKILDAAIDVDEAVSLFFQIPLPQVDKGGPCDVVITLRDMTARTFVQFHTWFMIAK